MRQTILRSGSCCNSDCENCLYCYAFEYYALVACDSNGTAGGSTLGMHRTVAEGGSTLYRIVCIMTFGDTWSLTRCCRKSG